MIILTVVAIFSIAVSVHARDEYVFGDSRQFDGNAVRSIRIDMPSGNIKIEKSTGSQVELEFKNVIYARNKGDAEDLNNRCVTEAEMVGDRLEITIDTPHNHNRDFLDRLFSGNWNVDIDIYLRLSIPDGRSVEIEASSTDVEVSALAVDLDIRGASSDVEISDTDGEVICDLASGDVDILQQKGNVSVTGKSSDVRMSGVTGNIDIRTSSGDGRLEDISGAVSVSTSSGDYRIFNIGRDLDIRTTSGDIYVDGINGSLRAESTSGDVRLNALSANQGDFEVDTVSGDVSIEISPDFAGRLSLRSSSGDINSQITGNIEAISDTKLIASVGEGRGNLKVVTTSGDIRVARY